MADPDRALSVALFLAALPYRREFFRALATTGSLYPGPAELRAILRDSYSALDLRAARQAAENEHRWLRSAGISLSALTLFDRDYPLALRHIFDPPLALFVRNAGSALTADGEDRSAFQDSLRGGVFAGVGTRRIAPIAAAACHSWIRSIAGQCSAVVSGFARGVDREVHLAAIAARRTNIAVLASGVMFPGPRSNLDLIDRARAAGVPLFFVSEFLPSVRARAPFFPRRNRIIAGLAERVVVLQAPTGSGALISARFAMEEGRSVQAFDHPGFDRWPGANDGARTLLAEGAEPVRLADEFELLAAEAGAEDPLAPRSAGQLEFWRAMRDSEAISSDLLLRRRGIVSKSE